MSTGATKQSCQPSPRLRLAGMRASWRTCVIIVLTLIAVVCGSCRQEGYAVFSTTDKPWDPAEQASIATLPALFRSTGPDFRARWTNGAIKSVCLIGGDIPRIGTMGWTVFVFDESGTLLIHNMVGARVGFSPLRVVSMNPLRIGFGRAESQEVQEVVGLAYTEEQMIARMKEAERLLSIAQSRMRSGDTNKTALKTLLEDGWSQTR